MDTMDGSIWIMRALGCVGTLMVLFVAACATVAAARIRHTKGPWVIALGAWGLAVVGFCFDLLDLAELSFDASGVLYLAGSVLYLLFNVAMLAGLALTKPPDAASGST